MAETITEILKSIDRHIKLETEHGAQNLTIGTGKTIAGSNEIRIWVTNRKPKSDYTFTADREGWVSGTRISDNVDTLNNDGPVTDKNSPWGRALLQNSYGEFSVNTPLGKREFYIENSANYNHANGNAVNLKVGVGEKGWVNFVDLREALKKYAKGMDSLQEANAKREAAKAAKAKLEEERKQKEKERQEHLQRIKNEEERKRIEEQHRREEEERQRKIQEEEERIKKLDAERKELEDQLTNQLAEYAKAAGFIRKQATLRFNPVLDKIQDEIKFCNLFNGTTTVINGGPGTGKTTTLIQRLKLLICKEDLKDYVEIGQCNLDEKQLDIVSDKGGNWIFFSPTELLKEYLKDNMSYEGLQDTANKVQVWTAYLSKILRDKYHLAGDNAPFSFRRKEHEGTVLINSGELDMIDEYTVFFRDYIKAELNRIANLDISSFSWKIIGNKIAEYCRSAQQMDNLRDLYLQLMRMEHFWTDRVLENNKSINDLVSQYYDEIYKLASEYMVEWKKDETFYKKLLSIYQVDELDDSVYEEDDDEEFSAANTENKFALDLRNLLRLLALKHLQEVEIQGRKAQILDVVGERIKTEDLRRFADIAFFNKNISPLLKGYDVFVIPLIAKSYKAFRKEQLDEENKRWNLAILKKIMAKDNRPLHPQEQALLLGFINNFLLTIKGISTQRFDNLTDERKGHKFGKAFVDVCCPVIGIDEATDYCLLDFYAINSLRHYEVSSITMTGDGMQCLKENGIFEWSMLNDKRLFSKVEVKNLNISYRQSKELLKLAHSLYRRTLHKIAPYKCYLDDMENVPKPLWYETDDDDKKAKWIVQRVLEIKENYGFVPSIAIFVANEKDAEFLTDYISSQGKLDEAGIEIKNCIGGDKLASSDTVRIFPIDKVKGMEFEVVFFHNIDKITNLVERYLYVGLSRATFYMGVTSDPLDDDVLIQIQKQFNRRGNWKTLVEEDTFEQSPVEENSEVVEDDLENSEGEVEDPEYTDEDNVESPVEKNDIEPTVEDEYESDFERDESHIDELSDTVRKTLDLLDEGYMVSEIAELRGVKESTIYTHIETLIEYGLENIDDYVPLDYYNSIVDSYNKSGGDEASLSDIRNNSVEEVSYSDIKLVLADLRRIDSLNEVIEEEDYDEVEEDIDELSEEEQEVRKYLIDNYAGTKNNLSYTELIREMNLDYNMNDEIDYSIVLETIENITRFEVEHDRPMLSAVIIKKRDMMPGRGFFKIAEDLGFGKAVELKKNGFWEEERQRLYDYWK